MADAFSRWTQIPTAAISATRGGQLAEDVSGANVILNSDRSITLPLDTQPTATNKPIGIVYDADGAVTDASSAPAQAVIASRIRHSAASTRSLPTVTLHTLSWCSTASAQTSGALPKSSTLAGRN